MGYGIKRKQDDFKQYDLKTDKITEVVQKKKTYGSSSDSEDWDCMKKVCWIHF